MTQIAFRSPFRPRRPLGPRAVVFLAVPLALIGALAGCASFRAIEQAENGWLTPCEPAPEGGAFSVGAYRQKQFRLKPERGGLRTVELLELQAADPACQDAVFMVTTEGEVSSLPSELPLVRYKSRAVSARIYLLETESSFRGELRCETASWEVGRETPLDGRCGYPAAGAERTEDIRGLSPAPAGCNCSAP